VKHRLASLLAGLLALLLLAGCAGTRDVAQSTLMPPETTAREAERTASAGTARTLKLPVSPTGGINPFTCTDLTNRTLLSLLYESLFRVTSDFRAVPYLCGSYTASGDGRTHTILLKSGVTFSDGSAMTAADAAASLKAAMGSPFYGSRLSHVTNISASGNTLTLTTDSACGSLARLLDIPIVKSGTESAAAPVGSGPYVPDLGSLRLTRSARWWQTGKPPVGQSTVALVSEKTPGGTRDDFELGTVSLVCADPNAGSSVVYHSDFELWSNNTTVMQYIGFNLQSPVFVYSSIRAAVTRAIDRDAVVSGSAGGFAVAASLPVSPYAPEYDAGLASQYAYSESAFASAMTASEVRDMNGDGVLDVYTDTGSLPLSGRMIVSSASQQRVSAARAVAAQLNKLGFAVTVTPLAPAAYTAALQKGEYDLYYGETRLSPDFDLSPFFSASGSLSFGGIADQTLELLCTKMRENSGNAYALYQKVMERGLLCPVLFKTYAIYSARGAVSGLAPCLDCVFSPAALSDQAEKSPSAPETTAAQSAASETSSPEASSPQTSSPETTAAP